MPEISDDAWIDLCVLAENGSGYYKDSAFFFFQYDEDEEHDPALIYNLRVALRSVGHKITRIHYTLVDGKAFQVDIYTTVPRDEWTNARKLYGEWCIATKTHEHFQDSDCDNDSDTESESEDSTDPI